MAFPFFVPFYALFVCASPEAWYLRMAWHQHAASLAGTRQFRLELKRNSEPIIRNTRTGGGYWGQTRWQAGDYPFSSPSHVVIKTPHMWTVDGSLLEKMPRSAAHSMPLCNVGSKTHWAMHANNAAPFRITVCTNRGGSQVAATTMHFFFYTLTGQTGSSSAK